MPPVEQEITIPEFNPPENGPKKLDWSALPEAARKRMVETMRAAIERAMSEKVPGPHVDLSKLRQAILELKEIADEFMPEAWKLSLQSEVSARHTVWSALRRLMSDVMISVGDMPLIDPMGASRLIPHKVEFYIALSPQPGVVGRALPGHGYVYYVDPELLQVIANGEFSQEGLESWRAFVVQNMAHELTHLVQTAFYPAAFSDYPEGGQTGQVYKTHPMEREARWASVDSLLRLYGPTQEFWRSISNLFGDELRRSKDRILELVKKYKDRILAHSGSLMTADAIARKLGLTEKAMKAFMKIMEPYEGQLKTVERKVSDVHGRTFADILTRQLHRVPTLVATLLNEEAAMRKLEKIWKMAAIIGDGPISDEEAEKWLKEFERQEFEEKETVTTVLPSPKVPVAPPVTIPSERVIPDPETRKHRKSKQGDWNVAIELAPPANDGSWPKVPEASPAGFPFPAESLENGNAIRTLFQKPETWEALKEMISNPMKRGLIQSYLVPKIVLAVGQAWWNINKHRKSIGNAPFGLFPPEEYKKYQDSGIALEETDAGRAFIAIINWRVAKVLQFYLETGSPNGRLDGYIYDALNRRMMTDAGKRQGFEARLKPICAYCRRKRVIETTPPILTETIKHKVQEVGSTRLRQIYQCPTCADLIETKEKDLRLKEQGTANAEESLRETDKRLYELKTQVKEDPDNKDLVVRTQALSDMRDALAPQVITLTKERDELQEDVSNRRRMLAVPYQHLICIREDCSGVTIPLTFVEWQNAFWQTPEGVEAKRKMASIFGIAPEEGQSAEDSTQNEIISESAGRLPPEWMWDVPFRCPFEHGVNKERNVAFTPREAFGHGKPDPRGYKMGGLFTTVPRTTIWWKPMSLEKSEDDGGSQRIEETRSQTGVNLTTDSSSFLYAQEQKQENLWLASRLREDLFRQRESFMAGRGRLDSRASALRRQMFDALLEWAYIHPIHLVEFFGSRSMPVKQPSKQEHMPPGTEPVIDTETNEIREHLSEKNIKMSPGQTERLTSSIIQLWFSKVLELPNGLQLLQGHKGKSRSGRGQRGNYLTVYEDTVNGKLQKIDGIHPNGFFVTSVRQGAGGQLEVPCTIKATSREVRGSGYGIIPWMALVLGMWDYDGSKDIIGHSISEQDGTKLINGKTSRFDEIEAHNSYAIRLDPSTKLKEGDKVIVQALFMPRNNTWTPNKFVSLIRQGLQWDLGEAKNYYAALRRRQHPKQGDEEILAAWAKRLREANTAGKLEEFYGEVKKRLADKKTLTTFEKNLLEHLEEKLDEEIGL
jgi:hypothetical protein